MKVIPCSQCPLCDYNLTGLHSSRCPECGFDMDDVLFAAPFWLSRNQWMGTSASMVMFIIWLVLVVVIGTSIGLWLRMQWNVPSTYPAAIATLLLLWLVRPFAMRRLPLKRGGEPAGVLEFRSEALLLRKDNLARPTILDWSAINSLRIRRAGPNLYHMRLLPNARWKLLGSIAYGAPAILFESDASRVARVDELSQQLIRRAMSLDDDT